MLHAIKSNRYIRQFLYNTLKNVIVSRKFPNSKKRLYFESGKNLNLFFKSKAIIEPIITSKILSFAKDASLFIDIGANIGYYSILLSDNDKLKIISVEPDESNRKILEKNISINKIKNITVISEGISSKDGFVTFYIDQNTGRTSSIQEEAWHPTAASIIEAKIKIITLNELIEKYGCPDLIKCDVEGHELEVLKGADQALTSKATWFIETTKENFSETLSVFYKYGYALFNAESKDYKMIVNDDHPVSNLLCIHKSKLNELSSHINIQ